MILDYYGFSKEPFGMAPDPAFLFLGSSHRKALDAIRRGIEKRVGLMLISGAEGLGKTTVVRSAAHLLASEGLKSLVTSPPPRSFPELLQLIFDQLRLDYPVGEDPFEVLRQLREALAEEHRNGHPVALFLDDAHEAPFDTLEGVRLLADLEMERVKLMQVVLVGRQPEIEQRLSAFELRPLKQRIAYRTILVKLTSVEAMDFIRHRIRCAKEIHAGEPFTESAIQEIARRGRGSPERIQAICRRSLVLGHSLRCKPITPDLVRQALGDLDGPSRQPWLKWAMAPAALLITAALIPYWRSPGTGSPPTREERLPPRSVQETAATATPKPSSDARVEKSAVLSTPSIQADGGEKPQAASNPPVAPESRSDEHPRAASMVHPPKALPAVVEDSEPKRSVAAVVPATGSPAPPEAQTPKDPSPASAAPEPRISIPPAAPAAETPASPTPAARTSSRQAVVPAPAGEPRKTQTSLSARSTPQSATEREKPRSARGRPDPSEIIDWFIDRRVKRN